MADSESSIKTQIVTGIVVGIILVGVVVLFVYLQQNTSSPLFRDDSCRLNESGMLVDPCVPLFTINNKKNGTISLDNHLGPGNPAPPMNESQKYIDKALEPYGGVPKDAVMSSLQESEWSGVYDGKTGVETTWATEWCAHYTQLFYGKPVTGSGSYLIVCITGGGKPTLIRKNWLSIEEVGMERVIPVSEALLRLKNHDGKFDPPTKTIIYDYIPEGAFNLSVMDIEMRYFASENSTNRTYLEPVWRISAVDNIRRMNFIFYIPASYRPAKYTHLKSDLFGNQRNFSQIKGNLSAMDVSPSQYVLMGTSGPIGKDGAQKIVRQFIENPDLSLTYNGRYRSSSSMCEGGYQGEYYSFNTSDCDFKVDVYSGSIISASINESCIKPGFSGKYLTGNVTKEEASFLADHFARQKYLYFDEKHLTTTHPPSLYGSQLDGAYSIYYSGDFGTLTESGLYISVRYHDGLIDRYSISDDDLEYLCVEEGPVRIDE
jgi:hypothetical protein